MIKFRCAACGQKLGVPDEHAGRRVKCSGCGVPVAVPAAAAQPIAAAAAPAPTPGDEGEIELDFSSLEADTTATPAVSAASPAAEPGAAHQAKVAEKVCPKCGAACGGAAALCTQCGHSFKFGVNVQTVQRARTAASFTGRTAFAIIGGAVAAVLGAALWAGVVIGTGYEVGWVAWGVGVLVGVVVAVVARTTGPAVGFAAAGLAVAGLLLGKLLIFQWGAPAMATQEVEADAGLMRQAVAVQMAEAGEATDELGVALLTLAMGGPADEAAFAPVDAKIAAMSADEKHATAERFAAMALGEVPLGERIKMQLSPFDLLWGFLAVGTAFKIGAGVGGDH